MESNQLINVSGVSKNSLESFLGFIVTYISFQMTFSSHMHDGKMSIQYLASKATCTVLVSYYYLAALKKEQYQSWRYVQPANSPQPAMARSPQLARSPQPKLARSPQLARNQSWPATRSPQFSHTLQCYELTEECLEHGTSKLACLLLSDIDMELLI